MHKLIFKNDKAKTLAKMLEWSNSRERRKPYNNKPTSEHGFWLVKDDGIYLMAPTTESFATGKKINTVVYARGYKPTKGNEGSLWDKTHAVSGDDFAEFVPLQDDQRVRILAGGDLTIELSENQMAVIT